MAMGTAIWVVHLICGWEDWFFQSLLEPQGILFPANLTITEICVMVGFSSLGSFSARFSDLVGEPPSAYRARWAASGSPHIPGCYLFMWGLRPIEQSERSVTDDAARTVDP